MDRRGRVCTGVQCPHTVPSPGAGAGSLIRFLVAEHTGILIVEIDLTRIGAVSRFQFVRNAARSGPLKVAAPRTAQTMAAEKTDRSRTEFRLCIGLSASRFRSRTRPFNVAPNDSKFRERLLAASHLDAVELEETSVGNHSGSRADGVGASDERRKRIRCPMERPRRSASRPFSARVCGERSILNPRICIA
jgi:hypothetical protein